MYKPIPRKRNADSLIEIVLCTTVGIIIVAFYVLCIASLFCTATPN